MHPQEFLRILLIAAAYGSSASAPAGATESMNEPGQIPVFQGCWDLVLTPFRIPRGSDDSVTMCLNPNGFGSKYYSNETHGGSEELRWQMVGARLATRPYIDEDGELETLCDFKVISGTWLDMQTCSRNGQEMEKSYWLLRCADLNKDGDYCAEP